jgi:pullulanase
MKANIPQMPRIAAFSDEIRDALRGPFDNDKKPGILGGAPNLEESVKFGIVGCIAHPQVNMSKVNYSKKPWAVEPTQMMSYVSCHDDMCLVDRLRASVPGITQDELIRLDLLAQTAVFTSQGVPFMLSGEELLRDKKDVHNSYESPDSINQLDWQNKIRYPQVFEYYKNLIKLRKKYPHFRLGSADLVRKNVKFLDAPKGVVAFIIQSPLGRADDHVVVVLNFTKKEQCVSIPDSKYLILAASGVIDLNGMDTLKGESAVVAPQSALILED